MARSVARFHPGCRLIIADNSPSPLWERGSEPEGAEVVRCGDEGNVSAARNLALSMVETEFFCLIDDDCSLQNSMSTWRLRAILIKNRAHICCGRQMTPNRVNPPYAGFISVEDRHLRMRPALDQSLVQLVDVGENYFVARSGAVRRMGGWDSGIAIVSEHIDFFMRAKQANLKVLYAPDCRVINDAGGDAQYAKWRGRNGYRRQFLTRAGLQAFTNNVLTRFYTVGPKQELRIEKRRETQAIVVLTPSRTGSSCLCGALKILGAWTGDNGLNHGAINPGGYHEDLRLIESRWEEDPWDLVDDCVHYASTRSPLFVVKNPWLCRDLPRLRSIMEARTDRVLWIQSARPLQESAESIIRAGWQKDIRIARSNQSKRIKKIEEFYESLPDRNKMIVGYHNLTNYPVETLGRVADFAGLDRRLLSEATATIQKPLKNAI